MAAARVSLLLLLALLAAAGCAPPPPGEIPPPRPAELAPGRPFTLWAPCTREEGEAFAAAARSDPAAALQGASCYALLARQGDDRDRQLADARRGRALAEAAADALPQSGAAHYLAAYLTGLEAERAPLRGLELVPVIEERARRASELTPAIDEGGPFRILGELYLRAPSFPVSIGDPEEAAHLFDLAVQIAPTAENRRGLGEALLAAGDAEAGCTVLREVAEDPKGEKEGERARELLKKGCGSAG